jgi:hypothetical protein
VLARSESLLDVIAARFGEGVSQRSATRYLAREFWDGEEVFVTKKGDLTIRSRNTGEVLALRGGYSLARVMRKSEGVVTIHFTDDGFHLRHDGEIIWRQSRETLLATQGGNSWLEQIDAELLEKNYSSRSKKITDDSTTLRRSITQKKDADLQSTTNPLGFAENPDLNIPVVPYSSSNGRVNCPDCNRSLRIWRASKLIIKIFTLSRQWNAPIVAA